MLWRPTPEIEYALHISSGGEAVDNRPIRDHNYLVHVLQYCWLDGTRVKLAVNGNARQGDGHRMVLSNRPDETHAGQLHCEELRTGGRFDADWGWLHVYYPFTKNGIIDVKDDFGRAQELSIRLFVIVGITAVSAYHSTESVLPQIDYDPEQEAQATQLRIAA